MERREYRALKWGELVDARFRRVELGRWLDLRYRHFRQQHLCRWPVLREPGILRRSPWASDDGQSIVFDTLATIPPWEWSAAFLKPFHLDGLRTRAAVLAVVGRGARVPRRFGSQV